MKIGLDLVYPEVGVLSLLPLSSYRRNPGMVHAARCQHNRSRFLPLEALEVEKHITTL